MRPRLCYVVSSGMTLKAFLLDHLRAASGRFEVSAVANGMAPDALRALGLPVPVHDIPIVRTIAPAADLSALGQLRRHFSRQRYDIVHSLTPKAGLLSALAGAMAGVPHRVHTFTGQVWATRTGLARLVLKAADRTTAAFDTHLLADSPSQRDFLVREGLVPEAKIRVLGEGSVNGVDGTRFRPDPERRARVRASAVIPPEAMLFLYLGRLSRDKGLLDLAAAFRETEDAWLLVVGPDEDRLREPILAAAGPAAARVRMLGPTEVPEEAVAAADAFVLPSYREGFGTAILESAAAGIPAIGTRIYGVTDAIVEGKTGLLVPPRAPGELAAAMRRLAADAELRRRLGNAARERALRDFAPGRLSGELMAFYETLLEDRERRP